MLAARVVIEDGLHHAPQPDIGRGSCAGRAMRRLPTLPAVEGLALVAVLEARSAEKWFGWFGSFQQKEH